MFLKIEEGPRSEWEISQDLGSEGQLLDQRAPYPPEFAQPRLSRAKWRRSNTPKFVTSPAIQEQAHPILYPLVGADRRLTCSNGAVQIRVGLELAGLTDESLQLPIFDEDKLAWVVFKVMGFNISLEANILLARACKLGEHELGATRQDPQIVFQPGFCAHQGLVRNMYAALVRVVSPLSAVVKFRGQKENLQRSLVLTPVEAS